MAESFMFSSVLTRVIGYVETFGLFLGLAFQKPGEKLLNFFFSHFD
jgi:hypothetical protein